MGKLLAFLRWRLDAIGSTARTVKCKGCPKTSEPGADLAAASKWAMDHAARSGHAEFDEVTVTPLRASLVEDRVRAEVAR